MKKWIWILGIIIVFGILIFWAIEPVSQLTDHSANFTAQDNFQTASGSGDSWLLGGGINNHVTLYSTNLNSYKNLSPSLPSSLKTLL